MTLAKEGSSLEVSWPFRLVLGYMTKACACSMRLVTKEKKVSKAFERLKAFWLGVLSEVGRDDESVKRTLNVLCMPRLNFGKQEVSRIFFVSLSINSSL